MKQTLENLNNNPIYYFYFLLVAIATIVGILFVISLPYLIQKLYFKVCKPKLYFNTLTFSSFINYEDIKFNIQLENIFKSIQFLTKKKYLFSIDIIKENGLISFNISSDNKEVLSNITKEFLNIEGSKLQLDYAKNPLYNLDKNYQANSISFKSDTNPIVFNSDKVITGLINNLNSLQKNTNSITGISFIFKSCNVHKRLNDRKKDLNFSLKDKNQNGGKITNERIDKITEKTNHGQLFVTKIYTFAQNNSELELINSSLSKTKNSGIRSTKIWDLEDVKYKFIPNDYHLIKSFINYSYLNSFEISKIISPFSDKKLIDKGNELRITSDPKLLFSISEQNQDVITLEDTTKNIMIFGDPDSGKSSGFIGNVFESILPKNSGGLFTTYKQEETHVITSLAKKHNRLDDLIIINPNTKWRTNLIQQELENSKSIGNLITKIEEMNKLILRRDPSINNSGDNEIWEKWANELNQNILKLSIFIDNGKYSRSTYTQTLGQAIEYARFLDNDTNQDTSFEKQSLNQTQRQEYNIFKTKIDKLSQDLRDFKTIKKTMPIFDEFEALQTTVKYFTTSWINMPVKQRESIYSMVQVNLDSIRSGFIGKLLLSDETDPNNIYQLSDTRKGKLIVLDLPVSIYNQSGRVFQEVFKLFWQDSMRIYTKESKQCFLVSDEFQEFGARSDVDFSSINRSANISMIYATQNYSSLELKLGEVQTRKLLGNFQTKVFFQTSERTTWQYARELHGEVLSNSYSSQLSSTSEGSLMSNRELELLPSHFQQLNMRLDDQSKCEAIIFKKGYLFNSNQKNYFKVLINKVGRVDDTDYLEAIEKQSCKVSELDSESQSLVNRKQEFESDVIEFVPTTKQEFKSDVDFLTIKEAENLYGLTDRSIRKKLKDKEITTKEVVNENNRVVKHYLKEELELIIRDN